MKREDSARSVDLAVKIVALAYSLAESWQFAKFLYPQLQDLEDTAVAAVRNRFTRPADAPLPEISHADRAAIYDATR